MLVKYLPVNIRLKLTAAVVVQDETMEDAISWSCTPNDEYKVASGYQFMQGKDEMLGSDVDVFKRI